MFFNKKADQIRKTSMGNTIHIVSGYMRTGTSMMMKALEEGGFETLKDLERDRMNQKHGDKYYQPNPGGFYENVKEWQRLDFPLGHEGKLVKVMYNRVLGIPVADYKIIFMMRDPEEIRQSYEAAFNQRAPNIQNYQFMMERIISLLNNRKDTTLTVISYRNVIESPHKVFNRLLRDGWQFDINKAVQAIDTDLCRFKKEDLTQGI